MNRIISREEMINIKTLTKELITLEEFTRRMVANRLSIIIHEITDGNNKVDIKGNYVHLFFNHIVIHFICYTNSIVWYCETEERHLASGEICQSTMTHIPSLKNKLNKIIKPIYNRNKNLEVSNTLETA